MERPDFVRDEHLEMLNDIDTQIASDMFQAIPQLLLAFPELDAHQAQQILLLHNSSDLQPVAELVAI